MSARLSYPGICPSEAAPEAPAAPQAVPVNTAEVQVGDVPIVLDGIGTVAAYNVVDVHTQVTGTIQQIGFRRRPDGAQGRSDRAARSAAIPGGPATGRSESARVISPT